jgi:hypothetical protein
VGDWPLATAYKYRAAGDNHGQLTPKWLMLFAEFSFWGSQITPPTAGARCGGRMLWGTNRGKADLPQGGFPLRPAAGGASLRASPSVTGGRLPVTRTISPAHVETLASAS